MQVLYEESFYRDLKKLDDTLIKAKLLDVISKIKTANGLSEIINAKKIQGYNNYYRIQIRNYRLGIKLDGNRVIFIRLLPRKDIYKYFP